MDRIRNIQAPRQKLPYSRKNKQWRMDNLDFGDKNSFYYSENVRQTLKNKVINLNLYNGIVDVEDLVMTVNPNNIDASYVPSNIPHNPIIVPKIDLLVGEELKRRFDMQAIVINPDAVSKKEDDKKAFLMERLVQLLKEGYKDDELKQKLEELNKYMKYSWTDIREKMVNQILKYYWEYEQFKDKFNKGFKNALIMAEEIYLVDVFFNEPRLTLLNPLKVYTTQNGNSDRIEDASMIIIEDYKSPNQLVDEYFDELKESEIDYLIDQGSSKSRSEYSDDHNHQGLFGDRRNSEEYESIFKIAELNGHYFGSNYSDENGNIRELKVRWKSLKKVKKIKYYDEYGETQFRFESEEYIEDKILGEEVTEFWINEGWEGVKLGKDIYLNMRPLPVQYVKASNPSKGHLGIIGQIYNTNQGRAVSLVDRGKNLQYMYDAVTDRLNKAIASNHGKIMRLDLSKVPNGWEIEKWMHFAVVNKIAVEDSFKEGNHGASTGKLAGALGNQNNGVIDMETGQYIQQHIQLLEYIKNELGEICGVSSQREGQISNRETVGGVERAVNQSSHITEYWFNQHDELKKRVLEAFIETAKVALRENPKKTQYILDDQSIETLEIDIDEFCESDYGIMVTNGSNVMELEQMIKQNAQAFIQNGGSMSTIMDLYFSSSLMDMRHKFENAEEEMHQRQSESAQQQAKAQEEAFKAEVEFKKQELELKDIINQRDNETKRYIADLKEDSSTEIETDDPIAVEKLKLDKRKADDSYILGLKGLNNDMVKHKDNVELKKESNSISRIKKKTT